MARSATAHLNKFAQFVSSLLSTDTESSVDYSAYRDDPVGFCRDILKVTPTPDQEKIMNAILHPPYRVLVPSGHNVGKTFVSAAILIWFVCTQGPSAIINSTAPSREALGDVLWGQIRDLDNNAGLGLCRLAVQLLIRFGPMHYAKGMTADKMGSFTGRHASRNAFIIDEALDVSPQIYPVVQSMMAGERYFTLAIYNPVDPSNALRQMEESGNWTVIRLSQETHPNIEAGRRGLPPPFPNAISIQVHEQELMERSEAVMGDPMPGDVLVGWRYGENDEKVGGEWRRPNYEAECRNLGRWPSQSTVSIWTPKLFDSCCERVIPIGGQLQIGVDVARYGNCNSAFAVRKGNNLLKLESYNGWNTTQISDRAKELCFEYGRMYGIDPRQVPVAIDDTGGWGAGVIDQCERYNFISVIAGEKAWSDEKYFLKRDEMWCGHRDMANEGKFSMHMLPKSQQQLLRPQALAAKYEYRGLRKKVLPKEQMAESLNGRSPDEWEAVLLSYVPVFEMGRERVIGRVSA